jgi:ATP-dependent 26S proteasome regulatory subunit
LEIQNGSVLKMTNIPYHEAKKIIEEEINSYSNNLSDQKLPEFEIKLDGKTTKISFSFNNEYKYDLVKKIANISEKIRISNSYDSLSFSDEKLEFNANFHEDRYFFSGNKNVWSINISKSGDITSEELNAVINMYKTGNPILKNKISYEEQLSDMGVTVYNSENAITWDYLAGYADVKKEVENTVILPLKNPEIYNKISNGTRKVYESVKPKAVLFEGPPGTGKTTMARIIANESNGKMIYVPIESIVTKWYGESEKNLSKIFEISSKLNNPIIFLDEIDALGTDRNSSDSEPSKRVLSTLLRKIDGFEQNQNTLLIGATNRKKCLDPALISRFDVSVYFRLPNNNEREKIFSNYAKQLSQKDLEILAKESENISGRNIKDICEHAERSWASKFIKEEVKEELPNLEEYLNSVTQRRLTDI